MHRPLMPCALSSTSNARALGTAVLELAQVRVWRPGGPQGNDKLTLRTVRTDNLKFTRTKSSRTNVKSGNGTKQWFIVFHHYGTN